MLCFILYIQHNLNFCRMLLIGGGCYDLCVYSRNSVCVGCYWNITGICYKKRMLCLLCIQQKFSLCRMLLECYKQEAIICSLYIIYVGCYYIHGLTPSYTLLRHGALIFGTHQAVKATILFCTVYNLILRNSTNAGLERIQWEAQLSPTRYLQACALHYLKLYSMGKIVMQHSQIPC